MTLSKEFSPSKPRFCHLHVTTIMPTPQTCWKGQNNMCNMCTQHIVGVRFECLCLPKFLFWNPHPQCDSIRRWAFGHEGGAFMNGVSALLKETPGSSRAPSTLWGHNEKSTALKRAFTPPGCHSDLRHPASRTVRSKYLLLVSPPACGMLLQQPSGFRQ